MYILASTCTTSCIYETNGVGHKIIVLSNERGSSEHGFNPLKPELNPICYLLALLAHHFLHVSRIRVKSLTLR
jgi:transposase